MSLSAYQKSYALALASGPSNYWRQEGERVSLEHIARFYHALLFNECRLAIKGEVEEEVFDIYDTDNDTDSDSEDEDEEGFLFRQLPEDVERQIAKDCEYLRNWKKVLTDIKWIGECIYNVSEEFVAAGHTEYDTSVHMIEPEQTSHFFNDVFDAGRVEAMEDISVNGWGQRGQGQIVPGVIQGLADHFNEFFDESVWNGAGCGYNHQDDIQ